MLKRVLLLLTLTAAYALHSADDNNGINTVKQQSADAVLQKNILLAVLHLQELKQKNVSEADLYALAILLNRPTEKDLFNTILSCFGQNFYRNKLQRTKDWAVLRSRHAADRAQAQQSPQIVKEPYSVSDDSSDDQSELSDSFFSIDSWYSDSDDENYDAGNSDDGQDAFSGHAENSDDER